MAVIRRGPLGGMLMRLASAGAFLELIASYLANDSSVAGRTVRDALNTLAGLGGASEVTDWYVDAVNGQDYFDGLTPLTAFKTMARLTSEIGTAKLLPASGDQVRVHVLSSVPQTDPFNFFGTIRGNCILRIIGEAPTLLHSGALTGVVNFVLDTTRPSMTQAGVDWAALGLLKKRCRVVSSATALPGTIFTIEAVGGAADTVFISRPRFFDPVGNPAGTVQTLSVGDVIAVEDMQQAGPIIMRWTTNGLVRTTSQQVTIENFRTIEGNNAELIVGVAGKTSARFENALIIGCEVVTAFLMLQATAFSGCIINCATSATFAEGIGVFRACSIHSQLQLRGNSEFFLVGDCSAQASRITVGTVQQQTESTIVTVSDGLSCWGFSGDAMRVRFAGRMLLVGRVWGTSAVANSFGWQLFSGAEVQYVNAVKPTVVGALTPVKDVNIGGTDLAYGGVPNVNALNLARMVVST